MSNFNDVAHRPLRAYNRAMLCQNIFADAGKAPLEDYIGQFSIQDKQDIYDILSVIKKLGDKKVKEIVTSGLEFTDEDYVNSQELE